VLCSDEDENEGIELYSFYTAACSAYDIKPSSPNFFGKVISLYLPTVVWKRARSKSDWKHYTRLYKGLKLREHDKDSSDLSAFKDHLLPGMFIMQYDEKSLVIGCKTNFKCSGTNVFIELTVFSSLDIKVSIMSREINTASMYMWTKLPKLNSANICGLLWSIQLFKCCSGIKTNEVISPLQNAVTYEWSNTSALVSSERIRPHDCLGILPLVHYTDMCASCQNALQLSIKRIPVPKDVPKTPSCPKTVVPNANDPITPDHSLSKPTTSDICIGTTPLKSSEQVLVKFFPHLKSHEMLLKKLSDQIILAETEDPRGRRYEKELLTFALTLWVRSPRNYQEIINAGFLLPSTRTLSLYKNCVEQRPGLNRDMFRWMSKEASNRNLPSAGYRGGLILDEMNIQKDLQVVSKKGQWHLVGLTDLSTGSNAMAAMSKKKSDLSLADHVLQFLFHGMTGFRMPFACYPTNQANAADLFLSAWDAISGLRDWEFIVDYISIDGSSNNRAFIKMLFEGNPLASRMTVINRADRNEKLNIIPDPSHLIKKVRNSAFNSGVNSQEETKYTRTMKVNSKLIVWKQWVDAFEWGQNREINPVSPHHKLSKEMIYLNDQAKMRNNFAFQSLNDSMLVLMRSYQGSLEEEDAASLNSVVEFLEQTTVLVRNFQDRRPITRKDDERLLQNQKVLHWFQQWEKHGKSAELMSAECREDLGWLIVGFEAFVHRMVAQNIPVPPCDINSDIIENFFCSQRGIKGGCKSNPPMHSYLYNVNSIVLGQHSLSTKSNTGGKGGSAQPYSFTTPGPLSKPTKKRKLEYQDK
jgi:hypothetical protein